jgi:hypothetical protein
VVSYSVAGCSVCLSVAGCSVVMRPVRWVGGCKVRCESAAGLLQSTRNPVPRTMWLACIRGFAAFLPSSLSQGSSTVEAQLKFRLVAPCRRLSAARKTSSVIDAAARRRRRKARKCRRNGPACTPSQRVLPHRRAAGSSSPRHCWTVRLGWRWRLPWTRVRRQRRGGGLARAAASNGLVRAACCPSQTLS